VTDPRSWPCRTAARSLSCLPLTPANTDTSASIIALITCKPAPTASANNPSRMSPATSAIATVTCSGTVSPCASGATATRFW